MGKRAHAVHVLRDRFERTLARHRRVPTAATWFTLGACLADGNLGELEGLDAIVCWERCIALAPRHAKAWHRLGKAYFERADFASAERALARAVKLDPYVAEAWKNLAVVTLPEPGQLDLLRVRRAERYLRRAIAEDPRGRKLGWEPYAWLAEAAERRRDDRAAMAWYAEANKRGDRYADARKRVIEYHGARRRGLKVPAAKRRRG